MRLTINDHIGYFPPFNWQDIYDATRQNSLPNVVLGQCPNVGSTVLLEPQHHEHAVNWLPLLWQLVILKSCRPDLKLALSAPFSAPNWHRLLAALGIIPLEGNVTPSPPTPQLTLTESQVLLTLLDGTHTQQLASRLNRDIRTVSSHKKRAMDKVGLRHNGELYALGALLYDREDTMPAVFLPPAEQRVLASLLHNGSVTATARLLGKSVKTVSGQKLNIMRRFGVPHEVALFAVAVTQQGTTGNFYRVLP